METLIVPNENDIKRWVKEAIKECLEDLKETNKADVGNNEPFISRSDIAGILNISLVTLTDWMKRGLPFHKQRGRVYFIRSEVIEYIKTKKIGPYKFSRRFSEIYNDQ